ncbi:MAG: hypothetical protein DHS20C08_13650 [Rhodomicrobium sp.]|nr:MAG: hypothetical protein DHS20C08_13650 [Rhodomicrobium sp.]
MMQPRTATSDQKPSSIPKLAYLYGFCGVLAFTVDQYLNWEFMIRQEQTVTALVIAVPVAGFLSAIAWPSIWISIKGWDILSALFFFLIFTALALFSLGASINRAGESYDRKVFHLQKDNHARLQVLQLLKEAKLDWIRKDNAVQVELDKGGCGRVCKDKKTSVRQAERRLNLAQQSVRKLGPATSVDPLASRLAWLTGFPEKRIQLIYPLLLPIGIWLASIGFTGAAFNELNRLHHVSQPPDRQPLEKQISNWMAEQQEHIGRYPTQKEAAQHFGISESTVSRKLAEVKFSASF